MKFVSVAILILILVLAMIADLHNRRIPNTLVLVGIVVGLGLNGLLPNCSSFNNEVLCGLGHLASIQGLLLGFAILMPIYLLRAMGAGDVKLMAMVGAFLGPADVIGAVIATFLAGGVMAVVVAVLGKQLMALLQNIKLMLFGGLIKMQAGELPVMNDLPVSVAKLPYAVAITVGTLAYLLWQRI